MQLLATGFLVSFALWAVLAFGALAASLKLHRGAGLPEKWLLVVPFLFASLVFFGIRYRFALWFLDRQALHELFAIGSYPKADTWMFFLCLPFFYVLSVLRPQWVVRVSVNLPLLVLLPFAVKLALYASGLAGWNLHDAQIMPTRVE